MSAAQSVRRLPPRSRRGQRCPSISGLREAIDGLGILRERASLRTASCSFSSQQFFRTNPPSERPPKAGPNEAERLRERFSASDFPATDVTGRRDLFPV